MSKPTSNHPSTSDDELYELYESTMQEVLHGLEDLRSRVIDTEATANAAAAAIEFIPYIPRSGGIAVEATPAVPARASERPEVYELGPHGSMVAVPAPSEPSQQSDVRRQFGRMQSLVYRTAELALATVEDVDALIQKASALVGDAHGRSRSGETDSIYGGLRIPAAQA